MKNRLFILFVGILLSTSFVIGQDQTIDGALIINPGSNYDYNQGVRIGASTGKWSLVMLGAVGATGTSEDAWIVGRSKTLNFIISRNSATGLNGMVIAKSGNVGFGTENPLAKLDVNGDIRGIKLEINGTIRSKEVKIEATGWADFVFDKNYRLPTLSEVESHINQNGTLPDIPSEKEVKENGIDIGEMQAKLLQKIEELTLYVIDLKKENEMQNKLIKELQNEKTNR